MPPNKPGRPAKGTSKAKPVALTAANERPRRAVPAAKSTPAVTAPTKLPAQVSGASHERSETKKVLIQ